MSLPDPPAIFGPEGGSPGVMLTWGLWCSRHLEPYRAGWPRGAPLAMIRLFDAAVAMPAVADAAHGETGQLTEALRRFAPSELAGGGAVPRPGLSLTGPERSGSLWRR